MNEPGLIAIIHSVSNGWPQFGAAMMGLERPAGTTIRWEIGYSATKNRNAAIANRKDAKWVLFLDSDHVFQPDLLTRLLAHNKDIVTPLYLRRGPPFDTTIYEEIVVGHSAEGKQICRWKHRPQIKGEHGLIQVAASGCGAMLVRSYVFETLKAPWFEDGQLRSDERMEDIYFCLKAQQAGFKIWCDLDTKLGHLMPAAIWPDDGEAALDFDSVTKSVEIIGG